MSHHCEPIDYAILGNDGHMLQGQLSYCRCGQEVVYLIWYNDEPYDPDLLYWQPRLSIKEWP